VRRVARLVSIVVVYPVGTGLKSVVQVLEDVFNAELDISDHSSAGGAYACAIDAQQVQDGVV